MKALCAVAVLLSLSTDLVVAQSRASISLPLGSLRGELYYKFDESFFMLRAEIQGTNTNEGYLKEPYFVAVGPLNVTMTSATGQYFDASDIVDYSHPPVFNGGRTAVSFYYPVNLSRYGQYLNGAIDCKSGTWPLPSLIYVGRDIS